MGNAITSVIKSVAGDSDDDKLTRDCLTSLYLLGQSRTETAYAQATSEANSLYAPISKVLFRKQKILCQCSTNIDSIVLGIKSSVQSLIQGQILDGVTKIVSDALNTVLGESSGQTSSENTYALIATDIGALLRLDVDVWNFETSTTRLQRTAKTVTAITLLISSVDITKLQKHDIRALVSLKYSDSDIATQTSIFDLLESAWELDKQELAGTPATQEDLSKHRALLVTSQYEQVALSRLRNAQTSSLNSHAQNIAFRPRSNPPPGVLVADKPPKALPEAKAEGKVNGNVVDQLEIHLAIKLCRPVDTFWINVVGGIVGASMRPNSWPFNFVGCTPLGTHGDVITYRFVSEQISTINDFAGEMNRFIRRCRQQLLPALSRSNECYAIQTVGLGYQQYMNMDTNGYDFVTFTNNSIVNTSNFTVRFYQPYRLDRICELAPSEEANLNTQVESIGVLTGDEIEPRYRWVVLPKGEPLAANASEKLYLRVMLDAGALDRVEIFPENAVERNPGNTFSYTIDFPTGYGD